MPGVTSPAGLIHLGMDTSKNIIVVGVLMPGEEIPAADRISSDEEQVRRLVGRFGGRGLLRAWYEAGPGGYDLYRLLASVGVACEVVAPSLIPGGGSDRVKTGKRVSFRLARLHRAGELTAIRVPVPPEEAVLDLARVRSAVLSDRKRVWQRLTAMLMRHGRVWPNTCWTQPHRARVAAQSFEEPALATALAHYRATPGTRQTELACIESGLAPRARRGPLAGTAGRLCCYRGIAGLTALTLAAEVAGWRRIASAQALVARRGAQPSAMSATCGPEGNRRGSHSRRCAPAPAAAPESWGGGPAR
jgi:transposase